MWTDHVSRTVVEILSFKVIWVTTLTFRGHVTSSVTWPLDSPYMGFPTGGQFVPTVYLARFLRYWASNVLGSRLWPFGVTWRHRSRDHWIPNVWFPIGSQCERTRYLARLSRYWVSNISGSWPWPLGVTWRHLSRDHSIRNIGFLLVVNLYRPSISHGFWDIKLQKFWGHDFDLANVKLK